MKKKLKRHTLPQGAAMASSPMDPQHEDPNQIDRLSCLPDALLVTILSLLPTHEAARTSVLRRRFRHLWEASPCLDLVMRDVPERRYDNFIAMADRALLQRDPSHPLLSLRIDFCRNCRFPRTDAVDVSSWLDKARSLGVHHLAIEDCISDCTVFYIARVLPIIFSISSLESLSLPILTPLSSEEFIFPSGITLNRLKSLSLRWERSDPAGLCQLLSELGSLEDLHLELYKIAAFRISSQTIRKLELIIRPDYNQGIDTVGLSIPSLEFLHLEAHQPIRSLYGDVPLLRKAVITLDGIRNKDVSEDVSEVARLLNFISHAEELSLHIKENQSEEFPFSILLEPDKDAPNFPNLKHFNVTVCFHKHNFEAVVRMLHHAPALESLKLSHETPESGVKKRKMQDWSSKLPRNAARNFRYACFVNLNLQENNKKFVRWLNEKCPKIRGCRYICGEG